MSATESTSQNITVRLDRQILRRAKVLAARRNTSISGLLAQRIEALVGEDDAYEQAQRRALALLDQGLHLGERIEATRDEWHEREDVRRHERPLYAHDVDAGRKHQIAQDLLRTLWTARAGILSTQVLQEFYVNATRKIRKPMTRPEARHVVDTYAPWCVDGITSNDLSAAFQIEDRARVGFWDALIIAVAGRAGARRIVSEDLNAGQSIAGITIHNPFKERSPARPR